MTAVQLGHAGDRQRRGRRDPGRRGGQHGTGRLPDDAEHPVGHPPGRPAAEGPDGRAGRRTWAARRWRSTRARSRRNTASPARTPTRSRCGRTGRTSAPGRGLLRRTRSSRSRGGRDDAEGGRGTPPGHLGGEAGPAPHHLRRPAGHPGQRAGTGHRRLLRSAGLRAVRRGAGTYPARAVGQRWQRGAGPARDRGRPRPALEKALTSAEWTLGDLDAIEINEAFACVTLTSRGCSHKATARSRTRCWAAERQRRRGRDRASAGRLGRAAGAHPGPAAPAARRGPRRRVDLRRARPGRRRGARAPLGERRLRW